MAPGDSAGFPVTLSQPASDKAISKLQVPEGSNGVEITGPNVTLDLNGFSIIGPRTCTRNDSTKAVVCSNTNSQMGVHAATDAVGATVRRGSVMGSVHGFSVYARVTLEDLARVFRCATSTSTTTRPVV